ncbi:hypothetical protein [Maribacter sp. R77961]|uniref:hypothetical protein n=1 Tax=Maribacter sp. R77961 TaxID=3093871 RepID=UPI0037C60CFF
MLLLSSSCAKDSDLFAEMIAQNEAELLLEEQEAAEEESAEEETPVEEEPIPEDDPTDDFAMELKAFPTAEGFGRNTTGGRGGYVYEVTNLNDSGIGSLRFGIEGTGTRTIIFKVCGTIKLQAPLNIRNGDLTIAGQTAPGQGISITGNELSVQASNVIVRNLRIRRGYNPNSFSYDGLTVKNWNLGTTIENIVIDHCSVAFSNNENFIVANAGVAWNTPNSAYVKNITIQNSISSQNNHLVLVSSGCEKLSLYNNYFAFGNDRAPLVSSPGTAPWFADFGEEDAIEVNEVTDYLRAEIINNIIYDVGTIGVITYGLKTSYIGNVYKRSNSNKNRYRFNLTEAGENRTDKQRPNTELYLFDNIDLNNGGLLEENSPVIADFKVNVPYEESGIEAISSSNLQILDNVGALPSDNNDADILSRFFSGESRPTSGTLRGDGFYEDEINLDCSENIYQDNDGDGMDDAWERSRGLDPMVQDHNGDDDGDGYTNLEEFLNYLLP